MTDLISVPLPAAPSAASPASLSTVDDTGHAAARPAHGWADEVEHASWRSLIVGLALLVDRLDQDLRRVHRLSFDEYAILSAIADQPGGTALTALARAHAVSRPRLGPLLARMQMAGWVQRECGPSDDESRVWITPAGTALVERAAPDHVAGLREYLLDHVDPEEFQTMARAFHRLCDTLVNEPA